MNRYRTAALPLAILAVATLAGCSSDKDKVRLPCPQVAVVRELARYIDHGRADVQNSDTLVAEAVMTGIEGDCGFEDDGIDIDFNLNVIARRGPGLGGDRVSLPYFIAVLGPGDQIIEKKQVSLEIKLDEGKPTEKKEKLDVYIPYGQDKDPGQYRVWLGFQLSEQQVARLRGTTESAAGEATGNANE
ncbi:MAG: hypothetical protein GC131_03350 [Alphaproteobacteria bacterium]|nr:hypothetical protein [Alphaproteobacteria bacterium]